MPKSVPKQQLLTLLCRLLLVVLPVVATPDLRADNPAELVKTTESVMVGQVMTMAEALKSKEIATDLPPFESQMALLTESGRIVPFLSDEGGRLFYLDTTMRGRKVRLRLMSRPDVPLSRIINVEVEVDGRWRIPQYYCDVCTIAVRYPQTCLCCQGPMEFRLKPER